MLFLLFSYRISAKSDEDASKLQEYRKIIANKLASVNYKECLSDKFEISDGHSVKGAPILTRKFNSDTNRANHKRIFLIGAIHGDSSESAIL
jgi:hypothetical protein